MRSGSHSAERELNKKEGFGIFTPINTIWAVLKEFVNSDGVEKDEYTKKDFANMASKAKMDNSEEIANLLYRTLEIEKNVQEVRQRGIEGTVVNRVARRMKEPQINVQLDREDEGLER